MSKENSGGDSRGGYISNKQRKWLIEFAIKNPKIIGGKQTPDLTQKDLQSAWKGVTESLNSLPGARKEWKQWRKTWQDLRSRTKSKEGRNKVLRNQTGGGPPPDDENPLNSDEERILGSIKTVSVEGHNNPESLVSFEHEFGKDDEVEQETIDIIVEDDDGEQDGQPGQQQESEKNYAPVMDVKKPQKKKNTLTASVHATMVYEETLKKKLLLKQNYYEKKLELLTERNSIQKEQVEALNNIGSTLQSAFFKENSTESD